MQRPGACVPPQRSGCWYSFRQTLGGRGCCHSSLQVASHGRAIGLGHDRGQGAAGLPVQDGDPLGQQVHVGRHPLHRSRRHPPGGKHRLGAIMQAMAALLAVVRQIGVGLGFGDRTGPWVPGLAGRPAARVQEHGLVDGGLAQIVDERCRQYAIGPPILILGKGFGGRAFREQDAAAQPQGQNGDLQRVIQQTEGARMVMGIGCRKRLAPLGHRP